MNFLIAETFTASLSRLTVDEQKAAKTTAFDLQINPASPGHSFHRLERAKDKNFWSVRVGSDVRLIVHRTPGSLLLCYVDHHDKAYAWAERRRLETHPKTGAAQFVEVVETVKEVIIPHYVTSPVSQPPRVSRPLFESVAMEDLLSYGVPDEWIARVRQVASEDDLLTLAEHLPAEASEALLELATGGSPAVRREEVTAEAEVCATVATPPEPEPRGLDAAAFAHPDAQRRFKIIASSAELQQVLDAPWEKWTVFLHPEQRATVEHEFRGPARVAGSAGTGKTVVALHRAVHLARKHQDCRVLLATFSKILASALHQKLQRLISHEPRLGERIDVAALDDVGLRLHARLAGPVEIVGRQQLRSQIRSAAEAVPGHKFAQQFLVSEWDHVVDAWQITTWESYRDVARLGRRTRLSEAQRQQLWSIFEHVRKGLAKQKVRTMADALGAVAKALSSAKNRPYDFAVIDEAQDVGVPQLRMLATLCRQTEDGLFFAGDLGQRIFQQPFSWKSLGVDVRGRSRTLRINYRTSHQIRAYADRLMPSEVSDADGLSEARHGTVSVFNGPTPAVQVCPTPDAEHKMVADWIRERLANGYQPHEIGVIIRSEAQEERAVSALKRAKVPFKLLDDQVNTVSGHVALCTMHRAKGLEFRAVAVMGCDDDVLPLQERIESVGDEGDLREVYDSERQLLYVACTRARDMLLVSGVTPASEFLDDLLGDSRARGGKH
jgi:superfamily I DNA/RNA helicase